MTAETTRAQIVEAADALFYRQGFEHTSFSDIAASVKISRGNFYYHFKSKDDILVAVVDARLANTQKMLGQWEAGADDPADRIGRFIEMWRVNREDIKRFGCPVGTLCAELAKLDHAAQGQATELFALFRTWLRRQFALLGHEEDADVLALHLLARSQGVAMLANAFRDEAFIAREIAQMRDWLSALADPV